jgi:hypothetical protein
MLLPATLLSTTGDETLWVKKSHLRVVIQLALLRDMPPGTPSPLQISPKLCPWSLASKEQGSTGIKQINLFAASGGRKVQTANDQPECIPPSYMHGARTAARRSELKKRGPAL